VNKKPQDMNPDELMNAADIWINVECSLAEEIYSRLDQQEADARLRMNLDPDWRRVAADIKREESGT